MVVVVLHYQNLSNQTYFTVNYIFLKMGAACSAFMCCCTGVSCACSLASCFCSPLIGGMSVTVANILFLGILGLYTIFSIVLYFSAQDWGFELVPGWEIACINATDTNSSIVGIYCKGETAVYRTCASLAVFFAIMFCFALFGTRVHRGFWFWKIILAVGLTVGSFFIQNFNDRVFVWFARVVSFIFLILQQFLLVGFAYDWNDLWVDNAFEEGRNEKFWLSLVLVSSFVMYAGAITGIVLLYIYYSGCRIGVAVITVTVIMMVVYTLMSLFRDKIAGIEGAILPSGVVAVYTTYLVWSALESNPDTTCKPYRTDNIPTIVVGLLIASISMMWFASRNGSTFTTYMSNVTRDARPREDDEEANNNGGVELVYEVGDGRTGEDMRREQEGSRRSRASSAGKKEEKYLVWPFHIVMMVCSLYLAMVVTNWSSSDPIMSTSTNGRGAMWVKLIAQWLIFALYIWTLIAPAILTNRSFERTPQPKKSRQHSLATV